MTTKRMCKLLLKGDSYFKGKDADTTKINKDSVIKGYCRDGACKTNEDYINALIAYIIMKFKDTISRKTKYNDYDEYLLMWISDKLFKMYHESQGTNKKIGFVYSITLNQAYVKHLKKHKQRLDYWDILNMQQGLKEVNLKYMSEFYKLLNHICKTIVDYETNGAGSKNLSKNSIGCRHQYRTLYMNIPKCKSYLHLLNKLKGIYDTFRSSAIKRTDLKNKLIKLTLENGNEVETVRGFKSYDFSNEECKFQKKKRTPSKPSNPNSEPASTTKIQRGSPGSQYVSNSTGDQLPNQEDTSKGSDSDQHNPAGQIKEQGGDTPDKPDQPQDGQQEKSGSKQPNSIDVPKNGKEMKTPPANGPSISIKSPNQGESGDPKKMETGDKHSPIPPQIKGQQAESPSSAPSEMPSKELKNDNSQQSHQITDSHIPGGASTPSDSGIKDTSNTKEPQENKQGTIGDDQKDLGGGIGNEMSTPSDPSNPNDNIQTSSTNQGGGSVGSGSGSKGPDNGSAGGSDDNKVSQEGSGGSKSGQGVKDSESGGSGSEPQGSNGERKDTGNDPSNKGGAQGDQGNSVDGPDSGQVTTDNGTKSTNGGQGDKGSQEGSVGGGDKPPTPNGSSPPQKDLNQQNPPQQNSSQTSSETSPKSNEQTQEQRQSQDTFGNQNSDQKSQEEHQKPGVNPVIIPEHPGSEVKGNGITGIDDGYVLNKYKKIVISIIVILIPITLTILYKYLSFGRRKELKKKTNMKKVINSIGGKKQIQIIIKSSSRKKQTKKSINSVYGEKSPSLNIYKIMQADPVPFINLFFLLIFFVYKRKRDFIEL
ncbi:PIR protein CIR protein [Plasmodium vinckei vinckei]|uniref:PIR protein CIR protein n=1 Tax=Plasmodium vinckei vinckei TaxID=54757 RepID=A0A449BUK6_PLAVN|nr:PIR protein CIR protein [Plasmodium vinckei vinckei]XP_037490595.1 PIR protein CIR protein [Plasmodium vinckei vinckei]VEV56192.1 PIR protein CIR protein [Plasmodium vinckei vinckei]VEV57124.1 PIR protein CIR protein [Plasmodium vinckei vinckei]